MKISEALSLLPYCMTVIRSLILPKFKIDCRQTIQPEPQLLQRLKMLRLVTNYNDPIVFFCQHNRVRFTAGLQG